MKIVKEDLSFFLILSETAVVSLSKISLLAGAEDGGEDEDGGGGAVEELEGEVVDGDAAELEEELGGARGRLQHLGHVGQVEGGQEDLEKRENVLELGAVVDVNNTFTYFENIGSCSCITIIKLLSFFFGHFSFPSPLARMKLPLLRRPRPRSLS